MARSARQHGIIISTSLLIIMWGLVACSPVQTPVAVATVTVIPSTATATQTQSVPTDSPDATSTAIILATQSTNDIIPILETSTEFDTEFTRRIMQSLADDLGITMTRVQLVTVESMQWTGETLCASDALVRDDILTINDALIDGFRYQLLVGSLVYEYHTDETSRFIQCDDQARIRDALLIAVDPLAQETLRVVQNLLATELDLSSRRVQWVTMQAITWEDTSLGCPQAEQTYLEREIPGYHLVVSVGNEQYIYHTDSNTVYPCPAEQSIIPIETTP